MTVKVVYLNGYFDFVRNVETICTNNMWFVLILKNGTIKKLDRRLRLEVSYQGQDEKSQLPTNKLAGLQKPKLTSLSASSTPLRENTQLPVDVTPSLRL